MASGLDELGPIESIPQDNEQDPRTQKFKKLHSIYKVLIDIDTSAIQIMEPIPHIVLEDTRASEPVARAGVSGVEAPGERTQRIRAAQSCTTAIPLHYRKR